LKNTAKITAGVAAILAGALAFGVPANAKTYVLRMGAGHPSKPVAYVRNMEHHMADLITKRVAAETKHKVRFIHAYAGKIAKVHETLEAVEKGLLDIGGYCVCFEAAKLLPMNWDYFTPFTTGDVRVQVKVKRRVMAEHPELYNMLNKKYKQKLLAISGFDNYGLGTKFAWTDVSELKGKKVIAAGPNLPWVERYGAIPVTSTLPTAYNALATGVASGFIMFPGVYFGFKFHEPAPYFKVTNLGAMAQNVLTMNLNSRKKLPADVLKIIDEAAASYEKVATLDSYKSEAIGLKKLKAAGAKVSTLPVEQQTKWAAALKDWPNERAQDLHKDFGIDGPAIMEKYMKYMEDAGHKWPYRYQFKQLGS
jgi:TRAP-type C4-dicarboxylate transport system substrate-binding protein